MDRMADVEHPRPRRGRTLASVAAPILAVAIVALLSSRGHGDRPPAPRPSATSAPIDELPIVSKSMVASDPRNGTLLLVGCCDPGVSGSEPASTWERIGTGWTHLAPATAPPYHPGAGLAFDPATATFLLQGGDASSETWSWDGRDWTPLHPPASPPPGPAVMTYSSAGRVLVLLTTTPGPDVETWSWDGRTWARVAAPAPPPPQGQFAVADDPGRW